MSNLNFFSAGTLAIVSAILSAAALDDKTKFFNVLSSKENQQSLKLAVWLRVFICLFVGVLGFIATMLLYKNCSLTVNIIRLQIGYVCIAGAACVDLREQRIPNIFPTVMAIAALACLAYLYFSDSDGGFAYIISSIAGVIACSICMLLVYALTKGGIGMGDIKLLCALALLGGANALACTAAIGAISCGIVTIGLLIAKKKKIKEDALPFAPFVFLGFAVSVLLPIA